MINNSNNIFGSSYSNSNPFGGINQNNPQTAYENLMQAYNTKLEALKKQQAQFNIQPQSTVFTDIAFEFKNLPEDEVNFIVNSEEYQTLNSRYQAEFSQFLINKFSNEYLQSNTSGTLEQMLNVIRKQKEN